MFISFKYAITYSILLTGQFIPSDDVTSISFMYTGCIAFVSFIAMLDMLKPLTFNFHIHLMRVSVGLSKQRMLGFALIILLLVLIFSIGLYLIKGYLLYEFRSLDVAFLSLFRISIGMLKFRQNLEMTDAFSIAMFIIFGFIVTILLINFVVSCLNTAFADAKIVSLKNGEHKFDQDLNTFFWWKLMSYMPFANTTTFGQVFDKPS